MTRLNRDTSDYTEFGKMLDQICKERGISFHQLTIASGMSKNSHATIIRACRGKSAPRRESILAWCDVLQTTQEQQAFLLHFFHYTTPEEEKRFTAHIQGATSEAIKASEEPPSTTNDTAI